MSKALVIKGVNFLTNKIDTITITDEVPCTGIALNKSTDALTAIGATDTLVPTLTPANTTDSVSWASSNTDAVTVNNGLITAVGIGSATITATCGNQSATCAVTVTNTLSYVYKLARYCAKNSGNARPNCESGNVAYGAIYSNVATTKKIWCDSSSIGNVYPLILGAGASTVTITVPNYIRATAWFIDSTTAFDDGTSAYAKVISGDRNQYDSQVALGSRTLTVPEGADSIMISLQYPSDTLTDEIVAEVSIVVS